MGHFSVNVHLRLEDLDIVLRSNMIQRQSNIEYPEIEDLVKPRHRFMSSYGQRIESCDKRYQYLLFAADPYEIISFKVPSTEIDKSTPNCKQLYFKIKPLEATKPPPPSVANGTSAPGVPEKPLPPPPQASPPPPPQGGAPFGNNPPRGPPPPMSLPSPPPTTNGPRPMPPGESLPVPPPPPVGSGTMANFTPRNQMNGPPQMIPPQGFLG
ncbi:hypothetical protein GIB67_036368 [Kingdonia uniflora]|uniref:SF3A2 domain-containing protein n=1 Tax=Kingdonia uniflora TaxID=39325 RepID=A0A7J7L3W8_9MAGN|nr:hypothetical protein GIB67_036368 [Kingdonia uniflora]